MTAGLIVTPAAVSAAEGASALPYPGDDPAAVEAAAGRITDAILHLATLGDAIDDVRTALPAAWRGAAARTGEAEVQRIRQALVDGTERLYRARSALFGCADGLREIRASIDQLRHDWRRAEGTVRALDVALAVPTDPAQHVVLSDQRRSGAIRRGVAVTAAGAATARAENLTLTCRRTLAATVTGAPVFVRGRGVVTADLGTALGTAGLISDDYFRSTLDLIDDAETRWAALGANAQAFALATAGTFPPPGTSPALYAAWWTARTWTEQQAVLHVDPAVVGAADGVPVAARDQANRLVLDGREEQIRAALGREDPALAGVQVMVTGPTGPDPASGAAALAAALAVLRREQSEIAGLRAQLNASRGQPLFLIDVDTAGRGQAVVAIGNPDTSDHVATYVPGTGSDVSGLGGELDRVQAWTDGTAEFSAASTAGVVWLGYESPSDVVVAAHDGYADVGAPALVAFQQGLRASHDGTPSRNVVIGHSYGALTVAAASTDGNSLAADGLLLLAPVGLEVGSVTDLHLDSVPPEEMGDRVVSMLHVNDVIQATVFAHPGAPYDSSFGGRVVVTGSYDAGTPWWAYLSSTPTMVTDAIVDAVGAHGDYQERGSVEQRVTSAFLAGELRFGPR